MSKASLFSLTFEYTSDHYTLQRDKQVLCDNMNCVGISLLVLLAVFGVSKGAECYACTSVVESRCGEDFDSAAPKINCLIDSCMKTKIGDQIVRSCGVKPGEDKCVEEGNNHICHCSSNLCNEAKANTVPMATIIITVIVGVVSSCNYG